MEQAEIITHKLKELRKNCSSRIERVSIEIVYIMEFTAKKIDTDEWHLFSDHFIGLFDVFVELSSQIGHKFDESFRRMTSVLCKLIASADIHSKCPPRLIATWLQWLNRIPSEQKCRIAQQIDKNLIRNCGKFLIDADCYSMQMRVMNIICSYLRYDHMSDDEMIMNALEFTNVFDGAIAVTNDVTRSIAKILSKNTMPAFNEMHQLLDLLNGCAANRSIFSLPIKSMRSAMRMSGIGIQKENPGWMHLNKVPGTVEIWLPTIGEPIKLCVMPHKKIEIIVSAKTASIEVKFAQQSSSLQKLYPRTMMEVKRIGRKNTNQSIDVTLDIEYAKDEWIVALLRKVFPRIEIIVTTIGKSNEIFTATQPALTYKCGKNLILMDDTIFHGEASNYIEHSTTSLSANDLFQPPAEKRRRIEPDSSMDGRGHKIVSKNSSNCQQIGSETANAKKGSNILKKIIISARHMLANLRTAK